jgi:hypothetical protein
MNTNCRGEPQTYGTPLGQTAQDVSRRIVPLTGLSNPVFTRSDSWRGSDQTLKTITNAEMEIDDSEKKYITADEGLVEERSDLPQPRRPSLASRRIVSAAPSIAAAPFTGPYGDDVERIPSSHSRSGIEKGDIDYRPRSGSSSSSTPTLHELPSNLAAASRVSTDAYGNTYPEGGKEAWLCVLGSFCGLM